MGPLPAATDLGAAAFGIVGVLLGGVITTGGTIWTQRNADKRELEAEARQGAATKLLLHSKLREVLASLKVVDRDSTWQAPLSDEWLSAWQDRSPTLASALSSTSDFETVAEGFLVARLLAWRASEEERELSQDDREMVGKWREKIQEALAILE